jgi:hypothetical protein
MFYGEIVGKRSLGRSKPRREDNNKKWIFQKLDGATLLWLRIGTCVRPLRNGEWTFGFPKILEVSS